MGFAIEVKVGQKSLDTDKKEPNNNRSASVPLPVSDEVYLQP